MGHQATAVENGLEALRALRDGSFSIVLMDVQMPVMDGYEATRRIRCGEAGEDVEAIPIIAMTAHAFKGDEERCFEVGMDGYVSKPFEPEQLKRAIRAVRHRRASWGPGDGLGKREGSKTTGPSSPSDGPAAAGIAARFVQEAEAALGHMLVALGGRDISGLLVHARSLGQAALAAGAPGVHASVVELESLSAQGGTEDLAIRLARIRKQVDDFAYRHRQR